MTKSEQNGQQEDGVAKVKKMHVGRVLRERFYEDVNVQREDDGFVIHLDARALHTPGRDKLKLPTRALAEEVAEEWRQQIELVDPQTMPVTRLCNTVLDGVIPNRDAVIDDIAKHAGHDSICYRAEGPEALVALQEAQWDPILDWASTNLDVTWVTSTGVMPVTQPEACGPAVSKALQDVNPFQLAAIHVLTTLTGSALLALAYGNAILDQAGLWRAAHIDEDFQIKQWGEDAEAQKRRQMRLADADAADRMFRLSVAD